MDGFFREHGTQVRREGIFTLMMFWKRWGIYSPENYP
jgi:hypothetical protein